jgi:RHS repeat-associated protein
MKIAYLIAAWLLTQIMLVNSNALLAQDASVVTPAAYSNGSNVGATVRNWTAIKPEVNPNNITTSSTTQTYPLVTQYLDGLGRPVQTVIKQGALPTGGAAYDMLSAQVYDEYGRQVRMYLPFADTSSGGSFQTNPFQQQSAFYSGATSPVYGQGESYYYGKAEYEESPLNRVRKTFGAGDNWVHAGKGSEMHYWNNTSADSVRIWTVTDSSGSFGSYNSSRYYAAGALYKSIVIDERDNQVVEYKDKQGKTILKKVQFTAQADTGQGKGYYGWLCTYYIYDVVGQLRAVIQPTGVELLAQHSWDFTWNSRVILNEQSFRYEYNDRGLVTMKKTPGGAAVYMVYDTRDRLVFSQDSLMRTTHQWFTTLYDPLNRPIITGTIAYNGSPGTLQSFVTTQTTTPSSPNIIPLDLVVSGSGQSGNKQAIRTVTLNGEFESATSGEMTAEIVSGPGGPDGETTLIGGFLINKNPLPDTATFNALTYAFYDNYEWLQIMHNPLGDTRATAYDTHLLTVDNNTYPYPQSVTQSNLLTGLPTGTAVKNLNDGSLLYTVNFYDDEGRVIQAQAKNVTGDTDIVTTQYSFTGQPLVLISKTAKGGTNAQTTVTVTKFTYDDLGRLTKAEKKISNTLVNGGSMSSWVTLSTLAYDALGQLKKKIIGPTGGAAGGPLDSMTYEYNIRGWLLGANRAFVKDTTSTANFFGYDLGYDKTTLTVNGSSQSYTAAQYNGNIAGQLWRSAGDGQLRKYEYTYDAVNRLTQADFTQFSNAAFNVSAGIDFSVRMAGYDANGNILGMMQKGWKPGGSVIIDSLQYNYYSYSNRLQNVIDAVNDTATRLGDFRSSRSYMTALSNNKTSAATDYDYDGNGNLVKDLNKDIQQGAGNGIVYNHLNLPQTIYVSGKGKIEFVYDAMGYRLKKITTDSTVTPVKVTTTLYQGGAVYINDTLQYIGQEEGRIRFDVLKTSFAYDYFIKDHLGNVRMVLTDQKDTAVYPAVSYETAAISNESIYYDSVDVARTARPGAFYNSSTNGDWVQLLRKSTNSIGAGKLLKIMAKDRIHVKVDYYIPNGTTDNSTANGINSVISVLANLVNSASPALHGAGTTIAGNLNSSVPFTSFLSPQNGSGGTMPKAYLNILFFDEQFRFVSTNSEIVQVDTKDSSKTIYRLDGDAKEAPKNGYVYVYVSNESNNLVYFDNLQITHEKGPITQETHYYPFGLTMAGINSKAMGKMETSYKFNAGTELDDDLGVAIYETAFRGYDAQIGRFGQVDPMADSYSDWSPYCFAFDDPVFWNDPSGLDPNDYGGSYTQDGSGNWVYTPFNSSEEAFLYGAQYASTWNLWGSYYGMAGSFDEAWTNYNGGLLTSGMTGAYFSMLWGSQVSGLSAGYADGGYNLSYTATSTGNSYGGLFFSMDYISNGIDRMMDVDRNSAPRGEDMTSLSDWFYQWTLSYNFVAPFANAGSTYLTGHDTYGVPQSNTQATAGMLFVLFPVGKLAGVGSGIAKSAQYSVAFEMKLASSSYPGVYRGAHFLEANEALSAAMASDSRFATSMNDLGINIPRSSAGSILGKSPTGWVWHHDINEGIMQLVPKSQHTIGSPFWNTLHPDGIGGYSIWGK